MPETIVIAYSKGGITKSTTAINLATSIEPDAKVCLLDLDQVQGDSTKALIPTDRLHFLEHKNSFRYMQGETSLSQNAIPSHYPNIDVVGARIMDPPDLNDLSTMKKTTKVLPRLTQVDNEPYDYIIVDPPGTLHIEIMAAWVGATAIVFPITPGKFSVDVFKYNLKGIYQARATIGRPPVPLFLLPSRVSARSEEHQGFLSMLPNLQNIIDQDHDLKSAIESFQVMQPIPENSSVAISAEQGERISNRSKSHAAYSQLLREKV